MLPTNPELSWKRGVDTAPWVVVFPGSEESAGLPAFFRLIMKRLMRIGGFGVTSVCRDGCGMVKDLTNAMTIVLTGAPALWKFQISKATGNGLGTNRCMQRYLEYVQCEKTPSKI